MKVKYRIYKSNIILAKLIDHITLWLCISDTVLNKYEIRSARYQLSKINEPKFLFTR